MRRAQGAVSLNIAYIGVTNGLLAAVDRLTHASVSELAEATGTDPGYVERWCDAAYAYEYL